MLILYRNISSLVSLERSCPKDLLIDRILFCFYDFYENYEEKQRIIRFMMWVLSEKARANFWEIASSLPYWGTSQIKKKLARLFEK